MSTLYVSKEGAVVRVTGERVQVTLQRERLLDVPMIKVEQVVMLGRVSITSPALRTLMEHSIEVVYLSTYGKYLGRFQPALSKNLILRKAQFRASEDSARTTELAREFVRGKLLNMRTLLQRTAREDSVRELEKAIDQIKALLKKLPQVDSVDEIRGLEGAGTAAYFGVFNQRIKAEGWSFKRRIRRPPTDPVNALLSFGYVLLTNDMMSACQVVGFDPYVGYLHADRYGKPALALDLMEEFRPVIVDSLVLTLINKRMMGPEDFEVHPGEVHRMKDRAKRTFLQAYEERKRMEIKHPVFGYKADYRRCFELQARILAKALRGEVPRYVPFLIK
ncbi:MAG: type I-D CRISPR-associated endonuclease Cas1d [Candidatus Zixiibacteriota bacterium]